MGDDTGSVQSAAPEHEIGRERAGGASQELINKLATAMQELGANRQLAVGDVLCSEGDESHEAYVIVSGCMDARVVGHAGEMVVARHRSGAILGEVTTLIDLLERVRADAE